MLLLPLSSWRSLGSPVTHRPGLDVIVLHRGLLRRFVLWPDVGLSRMSFRFSSARLTSVQGCLRLLLRVVLILLIHDPLVAWPCGPRQRVWQPPLLRDVRQPPPWQRAGAGLGLADRVLYIELSRRELADWPPVAGMLVFMVTQVNLSPSVLC